MDALADLPSPGSNTSRFTQRVLFGALAILALTGVVAIHGYNLLPVENILEAAFLLGALGVLSHTADPARQLMAVSICYVAIKLLLATLYSSASLYDFVQAYKAYMYQIPLALFIGSRTFSTRALVRVCNVLIFAALAKYAFATISALDALQSRRPGLLFENNFELIMLLGFYYLAYPYMRRTRWPALAALVTVLFLSGSRSAVVAFLAMYLFLFLRTNSKTRFVHVFGIASAGYAVLKVFASRSAGQGLISVDRYMFLQIYLREVKDWPGWEFLTGSFPLTPLSHGSCSALSYYSVLFSPTDLGTCYSVILHSFFLRALFDQGVLGLLLLYLVCWKSMRLSGVPVRDRLALFAIVSASAFSVSAFNSVFVSIVLAVALGLDRGHAVGQRGQSSVRAGNSIPDRRRLRTDSVPRASAKSRDAEDLQ
jgi:hypothetical protein